MSFVESPKVEYSPDGKPKERLSWVQYGLRSLIVVLVLAVIVLTVYPMITSNVVSRTVGTDGAIQGQALNEQNQPLTNAWVFVADAPDATVTVQADGKFNLANIPSGNQIVVVVFKEIGQEFPVTIQSGTVTELGALVYDVPLEEFSDQ